MSGEMLQMEKNKEKAALHDGIHGCYSNRVKSFSFHAPICLPEQQSVVFRGLNTPDSNDQLDELVELII